MTSVLTPWMPVWPGPIEKWSRKFANTNSWRCDWLHTVDDLLQDAYVIFRHVVDVYPEVHEPARFMALYKRAVWNKMHDRALYQKRKRLVHVQTPADVSEWGIGRISDLSNTGYLQVLLAEAPPELQLALGVIAANPAELRDGPDSEANLNKQLRCILGFDRMRLDVHKKFNLATALRTLLGLTTPSRRQNMPRAHTVEDQLTGLCNYVPPRGVDRQDQLEGLVKAVDLFCETKDKKEEHSAAFLALGDPAIDWYNDCVDALNQRKNLPEPPMLANGKGEPEDDDDDDLEPEDDEDDDEEDEDSGPSQHDPEDDAKVLQTHAEEAVAEDENEAAEAAAEAPKPKKAKAKKAKAKKLKPNEIPKVLLPGETRYQFLDGTKDKFGIIIGTKTHDAALMYEKGATCKEVSIALGGQHRNILKTCEARGHRVEHLGDGRKVLTCKDEIE